MRNSLNASSVIIDKSAVAYQNKKPLGSGELNEQIFLDNIVSIAYNKDAKGGTTDRRLRPQLGFRNKPLLLYEGRLFLYYMQELQQRLSQFRLSQVRMKINLRM